MEWRQLKLWIGFAVVMGIAVLLFLEIAMRTVGVRTYFFDPLLVAPDPATVYKNRPGFQGDYAGVPVSINSMGHRGAEYPFQKASNEVRILLLGDSMIFGQAVEARDIFPARAEMLLNSAGRDRVYRIVNAEWNYLRAYGERFEPDMVILVYAHNDTLPLPYSRFDENGVPIQYDGTPSMRGDTRERLSFWLYRNSALYNAIRRGELVVRFYLGQEGAHVQSSHEVYTQWVRREFAEASPGFQHSKQAVGAMKQWAAQRGKTFAVIVLTWFPPTVPDYYREAVCAFARAERIPVMPMHVLEGGDRLGDYSVPFEGHPNAAAHQRLAVQFVAIVRQLLQADHPDGARRRVMANEAS
jgi:hypothetical protein